MTLLKEKLRELEIASRLLEPAAPARQAARDRVIEYSEEFLDNIDHLKAFQVTTDSGAGLYRAPIAEIGIDLAQVLELLRENVDKPGLNPASGGHLGYIPGGGIYYSALGDYVADVFNHYAGIFFAGPGAVRMENMLLRWMSDLAGYPASAGGNLTSGGSLANLIAIVTARDAKGIKASAIERSVIYLSQQAHHSIEKAIRIAGLGECIVRHLPLDEKYRIIPEQLAHAIIEDQVKGLNPFLIVASAGTTDVGAIDPLSEIGVIAENTGAWFHIDAAYGGFFLLTDEGRAKLAGIERSDSLVIDPHKGLFLPYGLGVVLVKDAVKLGKSHYYQANYMQDALASDDQTSPADLSPELTKHFRGLRLWLPLMLHGVAPFRACLEEKLLLAKYFYAEVQTLGFQSEIEPELSVVVYRYAPENSDADAFNKALLDAVVADGRIFISSTILSGKFTLRFACLSFRTHLETVDTLLQILKENVARLLDQVVS
ncbi:MAG: aminotransferase class V-fold PLP-dependent enzyme [Pyrinomonadaceae bacterium]